MSRRWFTLPTWLLTGAACLALAGCFGTEGKSAGHVDLYTTCSSPSQCVSAADDCFTVTNMGARGQMCSLYCNDDTDCPLGAGCYAIAEDPRGTKICYARCTSDTSCSAGLGCFSATREGAEVDRLCLPR